MTVGSAEAAVGEQEDILSLWIKFPKFKYRTSISFIFLKVTTNQEKLYKVGFVSFLKKYST